MFKRGKYVFLRHLYIIDNLMDERHRTYLSHLKTYVITLIGPLLNFTIRALAKVAYVHERITIAK